MERAVARIDLGALRANCEWLRSELGEARLCAVVKADGYGHGAVDCARAALEGGATALAVATAVRQRNWPRPASPARGARSDVGRRRRALVAVR